ncbi:MAG: hypothetical protein JSW10_02345 [Pseudomonadota bacterium]|nr:MAG: hypothetical protein JSW10_02345 [Pseudomonadota bacterium]
MKILHILNDGPEPGAREIIEEQGEHHEVEVVDLSVQSVSYSELVEKIAASDKVLTW